MAIYTLIDISVLAFIGLFIYKGYRSGAVLCVLNLCTFFVVTFFAWISAPFLAGLFNIIPSDFVPINSNIFYILIESQVNRMAWFVILFIVFYIAIKCLKPFARMVNKIPLISLLNRIVGAFISLFQAFLICTIVAFVLQMPWIESGNDYVSNTFLKYANPTWEWIFTNVEIVKETQLNV